MKRKPRELRWSARAERDLEAIWDYIGRDDVTAADRFAEALRARVERLSRLPRSGRAVPELAREDIRELIFRGYRIVYRLADDAVTVLTIFEGHRLLDTDALEP